MPGSINLFNIGKGALSTTRAAISTTGHNIANANTEGYSRQRVVQEANHAQKIGNAVYGTGANIQRIERINDEYLTKQIIKEETSMGQYEEVDLSLNQAESIINEINSEGLNHTLGKFFNEFRKLGNEPESESLRAIVKEAGDQISSEFNRISQSFISVQKNVDSRIRANVAQVNELAKEIADYNGSIKKFELGGGTSANDLRDKRDLSLRKLSQIVDVSLATNEKDEFTVSLAGIGPLVSGSFVHEVSVETERAVPEQGIPDGSLHVFLKGYSPPDITDKIKRGRLGGLLETRDKTIGSAVRKMDEMAYMLATKVNEIHRQGYNLSGSTGVDFFNQPLQVEGSATFLRVSDALRENVNNIATALIPDAPGDNRVVKMITHLQHERLLNNGSATLDDYYNSTIADLATTAQKNKQLMEQQNHILSQMDRIRESISGVSMDEETTNLIQYQHAFDAAARMIKVADEMLDTVLSIKR